MYELALMTGAAAGAASAVHCAAMCGPLAIYAAEDGSIGAAARYHLGRVMAYTGIGALAAMASGGVLSLLRSEPARLTTSALFAAALLMLAWRLVDGSAFLPASSRLIELRTEPRAPSLLARLRGALPDEPLWIGALTALLPCGALASALVLAASFGDAGAGALSMLSFAAISALGLGLAPGLARVLRDRATPVVKRTVAVLLVCFAIFLVARGLTPSPSCCHPKQGHAALVR